MKKILLALILLPFMAAAQKSYTLSGNMPALTQPATAYLVTLQGDAWKEIDSVQIRGGKFQFTGSVIEPQQALITVRRIGGVQNRRNVDSRSFFLENSKISFAATDSIKNAKITGSVTENESSEQEAMVKTFITTIIKLQSEFGKKSKDGVYEKSADERKIVGDSIAKLAAAIKNIHVKFAESHLNSFIGLYTFNLYVLDSKFDPALVEPFYNRFSADLKSSPLGKRTFEKIEIGKRRQAGIKATDFTQNDENGKPFTLSSLRGKYVLVDFWASWCKPCRAENPNVVKAYNALKDKKFEIVSVSLDQNKSLWLAAIKTDGMPWIHVSDLKFWKNEVAVMYGIRSVPQNLLINPEGLIVAQNLRGDNLLEQLEKYVK